MSRRILVSGAIWSASILLSRVIGLAREAVLGRELGLSSSADVYQAAFTVPDFLNYLLAAGALAIVFVPLQSAYLARADEAGAWRSFRAVANPLAIVLLALTAIAWWCMPALARVAAPGLDAAQQQELVLLARIILPAQVFHVLGGLLSACLQARDRHALPALAPLVYNAVIVAGGLLGEGAFGFAWGVLAGSVLGPFLLPLVGCWRAGLRWMPTIELRHADLRRYFVRSLPIMIGVSIVVADDWILRAQGTLLGTGSAAALGYAKSLLRVPVGVFGLAAGVAAYPTLSRMAAEGRFGDLRTLLSRGARALLLLALLSQALLAACGVEIVALVYGRTRLASDEIASVASALSLCSLGLAAWALQPLLARGFYALGNTWLPAVLGTAVAVVALPFYSLSRQRFGLEGLASTSAVAIAVYALVLAWLLARALERRGAVAPRGGAAFALRAAATWALASGSGEIATHALPAADSTLQFVARGSAIAAIVIAVFVAAAWMLGLNEVRASFVALARRLVPRRADPRTSA